MLEIIQNNWNAIKEVVKEKGSLSDISYRTWVEPLALENLTNGVLVICFPCNVDTAVEYVSNHYTKIFEEVLLDIYSVPIKVRFVASIANTNLREESNL